MLGLVAALPACGSHGREDGPMLSQVTALSAGSGYTCGLMADGTVRCWGANFAGQLPRKRQSGRLQPTGPELTGLG